MNREEMLEEMNELGAHIIAAVHGAAYAPLSYVRRYNDLVQAVFGGEDLEIKEANEDGRES